MSKGYKYPDVLKNFIEEFFDVDELIEVGLIKKENRNNYPAIADRITEYFGLSSIFEYRSHEINCHITYAGDRGNKPFVENFPNIYD